jgi:hypothetical protein
MTALSYTSAICDEPAMFRSRSSYRSDPRVTKLLDGATECPDGRDMCVTLPAGLAPVRGAAQPSGAAA